MHAHTNTKREKMCFILIVPWIVDKWMSKNCSEFTVAAEQWIKTAPNLLGRGLPRDHSSRKLSGRDTAPNSPLCLHLLIKPPSPSSFSRCLFYYMECLGDIPISSVWILNGGGMNYKWHGIYLHGFLADGRMVLYLLSRHIRVNRWERILVDKF